MYTTPQFFRPDNDFLDWIIELAGDRMIFDVGFGSGKVLESIWDRGYTKLLGTDPYVDHMAINTYWITEKNLGGRSKPHFFHDPIGEGISKSILQQSKGKVMGILCRPCHSPMLVKEAYYSFKESGNDLYYIGLKKNVEQDLDWSDIPYEEVEHVGTSAEGEIVLKIA